MTEYNLPSRKKCLSLLKEYNVPRHIVKHSLAVAKLGTFLAGLLKKKAIVIDVQLVESACLLHDIFKPADRHEDTAYEFFNRDYPVLAAVIKRHRYTALLDKDKPESWEEKLLYYGDKRVMHDEIVPLRVRLEEAHKRYAHTHKGQILGGIDTDKVDALIFELEREIFKRINLEPDTITGEFIDSWAPASRE